MAVGLWDYYVNKSTYEKKSALIDAFFHTFYSTTDEGIKFSSPARIKYLFNAETKKKIKVKLIMQGYPEKEITTLFRRVTEWLNAIT